MLFDVRLLAFDDAVVADPAAALVRVFGLDHHAASELLRRLPHVVKRGVSEEGARKLVAALDRIGAHTEIVLSAKGPREQAALPSLPSAHTPARLGALPAPAAAARAMIDARAAREQAAAERAQQSRLSLPQPIASMGRASPYGHAASTATARAEPDHDPEDDSLEADIGMQAHGANPTLERATLINERPAPERSTKPADRSSLTSVPRGAGTAGRAAPAAIHAPVVAARASMAQPNAFAALPAASVAASASGAQAVAPAQALRGSLLQPATQGFAVPPQAVAPLTVSLPQAAPANMQRPAQAASLGSVSANNIPVSRQRPALPTLSIHGPPVEASVCTLPGTKSAVIVAWLIAIVLAVTLTVLSLGILTVVSLVTLSVAGLARRRTLAAMRASALPVGQSQLPEVYACVKQFALRLGLASVPRFYIVRGIQGLRTTTDGRDLIFMIDEVTLLRFLESPRPQALSFLVAQELCRHVLGHTKWTRRMLARVSPRLACLDLVSADSAATALVVDHAIVKAALLTLLGASGLHAYLDQDELDRVATSTTREPAFWPTRFGADDGFVLARLYHLQRGYV